MRGDVLKQFVHRATQYVRSSKRREMNGKASADVSQRAAGMRRRGPQHDDSSASIVEGRRRRMEDASKARGWREVVEKSRQSF